MMGEKLYHWLFGFLVLKLSGKYVERFINEVIRDGIKLWDIRLLPDHLFQLRIGIKDFFRLKPYMRKTEIRIKGIERVGFPFLLRNVLQRKGLLIGFFLFILMVYMLSSLVWKVEIYGSKEIPSDEVMKEAEKIGIKPFAFKWNLPALHEMESRMKESLNGVSWVGVRIDGVVVKITVVEKTVAEKDLLLNPRHLVAKKTAIVTDLLVEQGNPVVRRNQLVHAGELLVSGIIGPKEAPERQKVVASKGIVWGEVWYDSTISVPLQRKIPSFTGEKDHNYYLILGNIGIKIWGFGRELEGKSDVAEDRRFLYFRDMKLPLGWEIEEKRGLTEKVLQRTKEEAARIGLDLARKDLLVRAGEGSKIKEEKVLQQWVEHGKVYIKVHYAVIENIAEEQAITVNPNLNKGE